MSTARSDGSRRSGTLRDISEIRAQARQSTLIGGLTGSYNGGTKTMTSSQSSPSLRSPASVASTQFTPVKVGSRRSAPGVDSVPASSRTSVSMDGKGGDEGGGDDDEEDDDEEYEDGEFEEDDAEPQKPNALSAAAAFAGGGLFGKGGGGAELLIGAKFAKKVAEKRKKKKKKKLKKPTESGWEDRKADPKMALTPEQIAEKKRQAQSQNLIEARVELKYRNREAALQRKEASLQELERHLKRLEVSIQREQTVAMEAREDAERTLHEAQVTEEEAKKKLADLEEREDKLKVELKGLRKRQIKVEQAELDVADKEHVMRQRRKVHDKMVSEKEDLAESKSKAVDRIALSYSETQESLAEREVKLKEQMRVYRTRRVISAMWEAKAIRAEEQLRKATREMEAEKAKYETLQEEMKRKQLEMDLRSQVMAGAGSSLKHIEGEVAQATETAARKRLEAAKRQLKVEKFEQMITERAEDVKASQAKLLERERECETRIAEAKQAEADAREQEEDHKTAAAELRAKLAALQKREAVVQKLEKSLTQERHQEALRRSRIAKGLETPPPDEVSRARALYEPLPRQSSMKVVAEKGALAPFRAGGKVASDPLYKGPMLK